MVKCDDILFRHGYKCIVFARRNTYVPGDKPQDFVNIGVPMVPKLNADPT